MLLLHYSIFWNWESNAFFPSIKDNLPSDTECLPFDIEFTGLLVIGAKNPSVMFGSVNDYIRTEGKSISNFE